MPGSTARNGDGLWRRKAPVRRGFFALPHIQVSVQGSRHSSHCAILHIRLPHRPAMPEGMSQEKLVLFAILLGFALIALAALLLVIFLP